MWPNKIPTPPNPLRFQLAWGGLLLGIWFFQTPPALLHSSWAASILLFAVLILLPFYFSLVKKETTLPRYWNPIISLSGTLFWLAFLLPPSTLAGVLALPWLLVGLAFFILSLPGKNEGIPNLSDWTLLAGRLLFAAAGFWAVADRLALQPLGFSPDIVLLTAVHFHYAGLFFLSLIVWAAREAPESGIAQISMWLAIISVPLTALGITASQVWGQFFLESISAVLVGLSGMLTARLYIRISRGASQPVRMLRYLTATSLFVGMTLAILYAIRPIYPIDWLHIPFMRAVHGTCNALGIATAGLLSWYFEKC
jgi:hypothetical protein